MTSKEDIKCIKDQQKYVRENIDKAFSNPTEIPEGVTSDSIQVAFDRYNEDVFKTDNWNDRRISLFRHFFGGWFYSGGMRNGIVFIGELEIVHQWDEDQNYVFIRKCIDNDLYFITWYKSRGRTDLFLKNGKPISLKEFRELLEEMLKPIQHSLSFLLL